MEKNWGDSPSATLKCGLLKLCLLKSSFQKPDRLTV